MGRKGTFLIICCAILSAGCLMDPDHYAPVVEINTTEPIPKKGIHIVTSDETLYSIAWRYGMDYREIAKRNHIGPPYEIYTGQRLLLTKHAVKTSPPVTQVTKPKKEVRPLTPAAREPSVVVNSWQRPANGPIITHFSSFNKGINIGGKAGNPIYAAQAGKVVYSGHGLRGYGNLIIIKHNSMYLTAYAHNNQVFVKDGDWVKKGQIIAEMGDTGTTQTMLHFEIRKNGKPINPLRFIH